MATFPGHHSRLCLALKTKDDMRDLCELCWFAGELGANEGLAAVREDTKDQLDFKYFIEKYKEKQ